MCSVIHLVRVVWIILFPPKLTWHRLRQQKVGKYFKYKNKLQLAKPTYYNRNYVPEEIKPKYGSKWEYIYFTEYNDSCFSYQLSVSCNMRRIILVTVTGQWLSSAWHPAGLLPGIVAINTQQRANGVADGWKTQPSLVAGAFHTRIMFRWYREIAFT